MEECALCGKRARMLCESDQAKLCWDCDRKVHGANFLVAKHHRILLCRLCQSPTPWKACGPALTPSATLCHRCVSKRASQFPQSPNHDDDHDDGGSHASDADSDDDSDVSEDEEEEEEEEGENQVVPWSSASPPPLASSTNSEADGDISSAAGCSRLPLKRFLDNSFIDDSDDETGCSSSEALPNDESTSVSMLRPLKQPRINHGEREAAQWHNQRWRW